MAQEKNRITICVDGSCLGNPGPAEYRGIDIHTGEILFSYKIPGISTNNIAEYCAIVHAINYSLKNNLYATIYSDSQTAIGWVKKKRISTTLKKSEDTKVSFLLIKRAENVIKPIKTSVINAMVKKWDTRTFGEIPADFGYKANSKQSILKQQ